MERFRIFSGVGLHYPASASLLMLGLSLSAPVTSAVEGQVELGAGTVNDSSAKFGEYTGLDKNTTHAVVGAELAEKTEAGHWSLSARNLGLESRALDFDYRRDDGRRFRFSYDEIPFKLASDGRAPFAGIGSSYLSLPANWVGASSTAGMTSLEQSLHDYEDSSRRKRLNLGFDWAGKGAWSGQVDFRHETKQGLKTQGGVIGNAGGNPRAVTLPTPIDHTVDSFELKLAWSGEQRQAQFGYEISSFDNEREFVQWQNPYTAINGWAAAAGYPGGQGQLAQEPDNLYQRMYTALQWQLTDSTSAVASASYARSEQDDDFLAYTVNPALTINTPLPRNSLDGEVAVTRARLQINSRITPRWMLRTQVRYENKDNDTPRQQYIYIGGDSQNQAAGDSDRARTNLIYGHRDRLLQIDSDYRLSSRRQLGVQYQVRKKNRDFTEVDHTYENNLKLSYRDNSFKHKQLRVIYRHDNRRAADYQGAAPYLETHSPEFIANEAPDERFENLPGLRKFYLASRDRDHVSVRAGWQPKAEFSAGLNLGWSQDEYPQSEFGLTDTVRRSAGVDITHTPSDAVDWNLYLSKERMRSEQNGRSFRGGAALATTSVDPTRNWQTEMDDTITSLGLGVNWRHWAPGMDLALNYGFSRSDGEIDTSVGSALTSAPLPDLQTRLETISAQLGYAITARTLAKLRWVHERYDADDFRYDNVGASTLANVIAGGQQSPNYSVHWVILSFTYEL